MIAVVSPAKNLDFKSTYDIQPTLPRLMDRTFELIDVMRKKSIDDVTDLMGISRQLAGLNVHRYKEFSFEHNEKNSRPAIFAFNGDVYQGLQAATFDQQKLTFAQRHLRILSGLYGLLRPLDLMQPYRLEMGTKLTFDGHKTLYQYWGNTILDLLVQDLKEQGDDIIVNLASVEYFKSVDKKELPCRVIEVEFKDLKKDKYKIVSFYAKKARGLMSRYMIENSIISLEDLKGFDYKGYYYDERESSDSRLVFKRDAKK